MPYRLLDVVANCMIGVSREPPTNNGTPAKFQSTNLPHIHRAACSEESTNTEITSRRGETERQGPYRGKRRGPPRNCPYSNCKRHTSDPFLRMDNLKRHLLSVHNDAGVSEFLGGRDVYFNRRKGYSTDLLRCREISRTLAKV